MPEYLSPGVYVEEIDTGSKPIEGVSTSTAGMIGVTERGPANIPILITSYGEFSRWFGRYLRFIEFSNNNGRDPHCYLPHAVEGFFNNGGKRVYITRIESEGAMRAEIHLHHDRGDHTSAYTRLLRAAAEGTGTDTGADDPPVYVLNVNNVIPLTGTLAAGDRIRIGEGSNSEYRNAAIIGTDVHIPLTMPLNRSHAETTTVETIAPAPDTFPSGASTLLLQSDVNARRNTIIVEPDAANGGAAADLNDLSIDALLQIGDAPNVAEYRFVRGKEIVDGTAQLTLDSPLLKGYPQGMTITLIDLAGLAPAPSIGFGAGSGDRVIYLSAAASVNRGDLVVLNSGDPADREARRVGDLFLLTLSTGAYGGYAAGTVVEGVNVTDQNRNLIDVTDLTHIEVDDTTGINAGDHIRVLGAAAGHSDVVVQSVADPILTLREPGLNTGHMPAANAVIPMKRLTADVSVGASVITVNNRVGLSEGSFIQIGDAPNDEYAVITSLPNPAPGGAAPNAGDVVLSHPLAHNHAGNTVVISQDVELRSDRPGSTVALAVPNSEVYVPVTDGTSFAADEFVRFTDRAGSVYFHRISEAPDELSPAPVTLNEPLLQNHEGGSEVAERDELLRVVALDTGRWGDRLRISVEHEARGLASNCRILSHSGTEIALSSVTGIESGSVLEIHDDADRMIGGFLKVNTVDRTRRRVNLASPLYTEQAAALGVGAQLTINSREFKLTVRLFKQFIPAYPFRAAEALDIEVFQHLSMDPRHSRYVHRVIGTSWNDAIGTEDDDGNPLRKGDRRSEGESLYIRVRDRAQDLLEPARTDTLESIRRGPEELFDMLPDNTQQPARLPLRGGNDAIDMLNNINETAYIGHDSEDPERRTGLHSFRNAEEISIIACPGRTSPAIQGALITHCELMRYRFAVLDGPQPPGDSLNAVRNHRQQFDTKYASLYHPWLLIPDPYPTTLVEIPEYPIPSSGHILGIYARTDIERGVHKAPANEVVRGVLGLQRNLNKGEHDILNPYPVNINVIRDFRRNNRGIRVWGGRVITSDPDWKYVNVRRLLIFIEASIDRGLQWVVFEPNAEPLWARAQRTVSNFLTTVWRNGALEGAKKEEAYFVKCDRTTMTQADIDNGRLICEIGVAPVKPAEFVIIRIGLWTAHAED